MEGVRERHGNERGAERNAFFDILSPTLTNNVAPTTPSQAFSGHTVPPQPSPHSLAGLPGVHDLGTMLNGNQYRGNRSYAAAPPPPPPPLVPFNGSHSPAPWSPTPPFRPNDNSYPLMDAQYSRYPPQEAVPSGGYGTPKRATPTRPRYGWGDSPGFGTPGSCRSGFSASFASPGSRGGGRHSLDSYGPASAGVVMPSALPARIGSIHPSSTLLHVVASLPEPVKVELDTSVDFTLDGNNISKILGPGFKLLESLMSKLAPRDGTVDHNSIARMGDWARAQGLWNLELYGQFLELKDIRKNNFHSSRNGSLQAVEFDGNSTPDKIREYFAKYKQVIKSLDLFDKITIKHQFPPAARAEIRNWKWSTIEANKRAHIAESNSKVAERSLNWRKTR